MPAREDIKSILIVGAGPIVIGQACEFDYSGSQACRSLKEEGYKVILLNSNPATIMTDPELADVTYVEPVNPQTLEKILRKERPDAILPTLGGQTALNVTLQVADNGILDELGIELLGATREVIRKAEDRELFKQAMIKIGIGLPKSRAVTNLDDAREALAQIGFPIIIRPAFTLGGAGGGQAYNKKEFDSIVKRGLELSMVSEVLVEESIAGWKEFELEVMRDKKDNVVIICSIENIDPMGVHTGDSITVAPAQTLTDREYQLMRDAAKKIIREIGVETGGSNIQFAVNPADGELVVIEMNPRVSRSSALASKATGFPIAKIAAKLAVGYTMDELPNDITLETPACFEPSIDYVVLKIPRFTFEKFPAADPILGVQMKAVGETMAIGRTFREALQKALRSLELGRFGFIDEHDKGLFSKEQLKDAVRDPKAERIFYVARALAQGLSVDEIFESSKIDPWFLDQMQLIILESEEIKTQDPLKWSVDEWREVKKHGFSDKHIGFLTGHDEMTIRDRRFELDVYPGYGLVDTCAGEFAARTPYYYSNYESPCEARFDEHKKKIIILGGGPNRIGQGIEFDYCCVHASMALKEAGYETVMVNSNPETVSTDYDVSNQLFFEPLTAEDVLNICHRVKPDGVIVQFGGQTPLNLCHTLQQYGVPIIGTSVEAIDRCEDRELFKDVINKLKLKQPPSGMANSLEEAEKIAEEVGYPVLARPSYVLGGRGMQIAYDRDELASFMEEATSVNPEHPILVDKFLELAAELDVDAISDGETVVVGAIMEHIEEAGIHSGDSTAVLPPFSIREEVLDEIRRQTVALALELNVVGLMNIQFAVRKDVVYIIEVNPRASRTVPFVSKAIGVQLAKLASLVMVGQKLKDLGYDKEIIPDHVAVKEPVFPFNRFDKVDILLGPEMRSTGEVMGISKDIGHALAKAKAGAMLELPSSGKVLVSIKDDDKEEALQISKELKELGLSIVCTVGTARYFKKQGFTDVEEVHRLGKGRPDVLDIITNEEVQMVINTPSGIQAREDEIRIRRGTILYNTPCITTMRGAKAAVRAIRSLVKEDLDVTSLQEFSVH
jgi:carbamoyl-phosphate synthase large subunit